MLQIIAIDKIKESWIREGIDIYVKRLSNRLKLEIIELPAAKYSIYDNITKAKEFESLKILSLLTGSDMVVALDEKGSSYSTIAFSNLVFDTINHKHIKFVIGGAYGLHESIIDKADLVLNLSKMTFTHEMGRLFLVEQIYRAYTINAGIKYHNV